MLPRPPRVSVSCSSSRCISLLLYWNLDVAVRWEGRPSALVCGFYVFLYSSFSRHRKTRGSWREGNALPSPVKGKAPVNLSSRMVGLSQVEWSPWGLLFPLSLSKPRELFLEILLWEHSGFLGDKGWVLSHTTRNPRNIFSHSKFHTQVPDFDKITF